LLDIALFSDAVARICDASMDVERWDDALATLGRAFDSDRGQVSFFEGFSAERRIRQDVGIRRLQRIHSRAPSGCRANARSAL
jgi:hypothetical protein